MRTVWIVARYELKTRLRGGSYWFLLVVLPALAIYLVGLGTQAIAASVPAALRMDVLDEDQSAVSRGFVASLAADDETLVICPHEPDPTDICALGPTESSGRARAPLTPELAAQRLAGEVSVATLTISRGFGAALGAENGRANSPQLVFRPGASLASSATAFTAVRQAVARVSGPIIAARLSTEFAAGLGIETGREFYAARRADAEAAWESPKVVVAAETARPDRGRLMGAQLLENGFKLSTPSIAAMFVMISILGLTQALAEERATGVLGRLAALPVGKAQLLGGKLLATCVMGLLQCGVLLAFGAALNSQPDGEPWMAAAILLVAAAYVLAVTALALALVALTDTPSQASALGTLAWAVLVPLGGGWWPLAFVPGWLQVIGHISPVAWFLDALNALIFFGGTWADVLLPAGVLLLFAAALFALGVRLFGLASRPDGRRSGWGLLGRRGGDTAPFLPYFGERE